MRQQATAIPCAANRCCPSGQDRRMHAAWQFRPL